MEYRRSRGPEERTRGSAKVQIGAELLCKGAKVNLRVGKSSRSQVSAVGSQVQVFRFGCRFRI